MRDKKSRYKIGRPPKYETAEELQKSILDYFENGIQTREVLVGPANNRRIEEIPVPTITGLVLHCGFCNRATFYDLEKDEKFSHTIKKARTFIEEKYEELLQTVGGSAIIFALKNFGWEDKSEVKYDINGDLASRILAARNKVKK